MRITENQLRQIIREELEDEIEEAHAGSLDPVEAEREDDDEEDADEFALGAFARGGVNKPGAAAFARSSSFEKLAKQAYANLPFPVWTAPYLGGMHRWGIGLSTRGDVVPLVPDGMKRLGQVGFKGLDRIDGGDCVILYNAVVTDIRLLATPWMIFHAMLDEEYTSAAGELSPIWGDLHEDVMGRSNYFPGIHPLRRRSDKSWFGALTMKSAREGHVTNHADAFAEVMCQEVLTSGGFRFNREALDPALVGPMEELQRVVRRAGQEFKQNMSGKLILVSVH